MTFRNLLAGSAVLAVVAVLPAHAPADAVEPVPFDGKLEITAGNVVATVTVPPTAVQEYVSRVFLYDVYSACWNRRGKVLANTEQRVGGGRVPGTANDYQVRFPPQSEATFTFASPLQELLDTADAAQRSTPCPAGTAAGVLRLHFHALEVYSTSFGTHAVPTARADHFVQHLGQSSGKTRR